MTIWCDVCGDIVTIAYPLELKFHDNTVYKLNVCPICFDKRKLIIDLKRKHLVAKLVTEIR